MQLRIRGPSQKIDRFSSNEMPVTSLSLSLSYINVEVFYHHYSHHFHFHLPKTVRVGITKQNIVLTMFLRRVHQVHKLKQGLLLMGDRAFQLGQEHPYCTHCSYPANCATKTVLDSRLEIDFQYFLLTMMSLSDLGKSFSVLLSFCNQCVSNPRMFLLRELINKSTDQVVLNIVNTCISPPQSRCGLLLHNTLTYINLLCEAVMLSCF